MKRAAVTMPQAERDDDAAALTEVASRAAFDRRLEAASAEGTPVALLAIDVDDFTAYNQRYGQPAGDATLRQVARRAAQCLLSQEHLLVRSDGAQFLALLPDADLDGAARLAETLRAAIYDVCLAHADSPEGVVTVSVGVASARAQGSGAPLLEEAARALHAAKTGGGNRIARSDDSGARDDAQPLGPPVVLPVPTSRFFGREKELEALARLTASERLVTIVGPGGIGKTRLALQNALARTARYPDAVRFADFGSVSNPDRVPSVVASALGLSLSPDMPVISQITRAIEQRKMLIIFDNCEHVIEGCASLAETLLRASAGLHIVATAREALRIDGEITYALSPLSEEEAVELFTERALAVDPNLRISEEDRPVLLELCTALDRIPMAIELAAARVNMFNVRQLHENLHDRFNLLSEGRRFANARQQTLWNLIDWSYRLLDEEERRLFARLSVLAGEWTFAAAEPVCFDDSFAQEGRLPLFGRLVSKSLVTTTRHPAGVRYRLLESIRDYAHRKLNESGEAAEIKTRHATYFAAFVQRTFAENDVSQSDRFIALVDQEYANLRSALAWVNEDRNAELAARMTSVMDHFWLGRGQFREGRQWIELCLKMAHEITPVLRVQLYRSLIRLSFYESDYPAMGDAASKAVALYERLGDRTGLAQAQNALGIVKHLFGETGEAETLFRRSLEVSRELGNHRDAAHSLSNLGAIALDRRGDFAEAMRIFEECYQLSRERGDRRSESIDLSNMAAAAFYLGDLTRAIQFSRMALKMSSNLQIEPLVGSELIKLGRYELEKGNTAEAVLALKKGLGITRRQHNHEYIAQALETFARVAWRLGRFTDGAQMLGYAQKYRSRHNVPVLPLGARETQELRDALAKPLSPAAFERQWRSGERLTLAQVTKIAVNFLNRGKKTR